MAGTGIGLLNKYGNPYEDEQYEDDVPETGADGVAVDAAPLKGTGIGRLNKFGGADNTDYSTLDHQAAITSLADARAKEKLYDEEHSTFDKIGNYLEKGWKGYTATKAFDRAEDQAADAQRFNDQAQRDNRPKGRNQRQASDRAIANEAASKQNIQSYIDDSAQAAAIDSSPAARYVMQSETFGQAMEGLTDIDLFGFIGEVGLTSLPQALESLGAAAVGGMAAGLPGAMAGAFAGTRNVELTNTVIGNMVELGVDVNDPAAIYDAFQDKGFMQAMTRDAEKRADVVALFDALSVGVAGAPMKALKPIAEVGAKTLIGGALGGAGEYAGEKARGREARPGEIVAEAVGEMFQAPAEIATASLGRGPVTVSNDVNNNNVIRTQAADDIAADAPVDPNAFTDDEIAAMNAGVQGLNNDADTNGGVDGVDTGTDGDADGDTGSINTGTGDNVDSNTGQLELTGEVELEPTPEAEPEVYENLYEEEGDIYALDNEGEYLLDDAGEYIITNADGVRINGPEPTPEAAPTPEPQSSAEPLAPDEAQLQRLEQAYKLSTTDADTLFAEQYGESRIKPAPINAPLEQRRAVRRDIEKQQGRIEKRTGEDAQTQNATIERIAKRTTMSIEGNRMLEREIRKLRVEVAERQESDTYLAQMERLAGLQDFTIEQNIEAGSESDMLGGETLQSTDIDTNPQPVEQAQAIPTDTTNSATAESQADPSESTTEGNNDEKVSNSDTRGDSTQRDAGINTDQRQLEDNTVPGSESQTGQPDSDTNGNLEQAGTELEYDGQEDRPESGRQVRLETEPTAQRGRSVNDLPRSEIARRAAALSERELDDAVDRFSQKANGRVEAFSTSDQLNPEQQAHYDKRAADSPNHETPAFYDPTTDRIYVNKSLVKAADVESVIAHEATHAGLQDQYGSEAAITHAMNELAQAAGGPAFVAKLAKKLGIPVDRYIGSDTFNPTLDDMATLIEEVLAFSAQDRAGYNLAQKIISGIRDTMGRLGVTLPYIGRGKADMAVINAMRDAQRAYNRVTAVTRYEPTLNERVDNAIPDTEQKRIRENIRAKHSNEQAERDALPHGLSGITGVKASAAQRQQIREGEQRRLKFLTSPANVYSTWRHSDARAAAARFWNKGLQPKNIVGKFTYDMRQLTESEKAGDEQAVVYMVNAFNKALDQFKYNATDRLRVDTMINSHLANEISTMIDPKLQDAATIVRSAEVTSENANAYLFKGKKIPDNLKPAFRVLMNTTFSSKDLKVAHAFITGKVNPEIPNTLHEPLGDMRRHLDGHSAQILQHVNDQIGLRIKSLGDNQYAEYLNYMDIRGGDPHSETSFGEMGDMPGALVALHNLHDTISGNLGRYMHRSYKAFEDPDYLHSFTKDKAKLSRAIEGLKKQRTDDYLGNLDDDQIADMQEWIDNGGDAQQVNLAAWLKKGGDPQKIPDDLALKGVKPRGYNAYLKSIRDGEVEQTIRNILQDAADAGGVVNLMTNRSMYGSKELSTLMRRQDITPIMREILGEHTDPRVNFVKSSHKMKNLIVKQEFLNALAQELTNDMLWHESPPGGQFNARIASKNSTAMNPLDGMRTTVEFRDVLQSWTEPAQVSEFMRRYMAFNGAVKLGKTVYNTGTHVANVGSNLLMALVNGTLRPADLMMATRLYGADMFGDTAWGRFYAGKSHTVQEFRDMRTELVRRGVLSDGVNSGEVQAMMNDARTSRETIGKKLMETGVGKLAGGVDNIVKRQYQWEDDFFKAAAYLAEVKDYKKRGMSDEEAKVHAAQRVRDTFPTYSEIPPLVQSIRRFPLVGSFVSFSSEMIRVTANQPHYFREDWKHDKTKFAQRVVGSIAGGFLLQGIAAASKWENDISDEDDELFRKLLPPWSTNGTIWYLGTNDNGAMEYIDLSRFDPWSHYRKMFNVITSSSQETLGQKLFEFIIAAGEPFLAPEILADTIADIAANQRYGISGFPIRNSEKDKVDQAVELGNYAWRSLAPGAALSALRMFKAADGDVSFSGKQFTVKDELYALGGFRKSTINLQAALSRQTQVLSLKLKSSSTIMNENIWDQSARTEAQLEKSFNNMIKARERNFRGAIKMINGFRGMGLSDKEIQGYMEGQGVGKDNIRLLMKDRIPEYEMSDTLGERPLKRATVAAGSNEQLKRQLADRFEYKKDTVERITKDYYKDKKRSEQAN